MEVSKDMDTIYGVLFQGIKCLKRIEAGQFLTLVFGFENETNEKNGWSSLTKEVFPMDSNMVPLWEITWGNSKDCLSSTTTSLSSVGDVCLGLLDILDREGSCALCSLVAVPEGVTLLDYINFFSGSSTVH